MRLQIFTVHLHYGHEKEDQVWQTPSIEEARRWVENAKYGRILNNNNIYVQ